MTRPRAIIFTALQVETEAVTAHLDDVRAVRWENDVHQRGSFTDGLDWDVLVVQTGPENQAAALETQAALLIFEPAAAIFVGIAGGFREKAVREFDLIVPPRVEYYAAGKAGDALTLRPRQHGPSRYMIAAARQVEREGRWLDRLKSPAERMPTVHLEPLASGDHVVKSLDSATYKFIRENLDQVVAVDMESSGFFFATSLRPEVQSIVVRAVSDLLSDKQLDRDASRQPEAARIASAFAFELLATTPADRLSIRSMPADPRAWGPAEPTAAGPVTTENSPGDSHARDAVALGEELAGIIDLDRWHARTEGIFFGNSPTISIDLDQRLDQALAWTSSRIAIPGLEDVIDAIANFGAVLRDFRDVFHREAQTTPDGSRLQVVQFYRQYDKSALERERLIDEYTEYILLIKDLAAELTRAINLVDERIRDHQPRYRITEGAAGIFAGTDDAFLVVRYSGEERLQPAPYPGLRCFPQVLGARDGHFGPHQEREPWPEELLDQLDAALAAGETDTAHHVAFDFAAQVADRMGERQAIQVAGGPRGDHTVRFRPVTVRWQSSDGLWVGDPVRHLARTWINRRGEVDTSRERLVGTRTDGAVGEVLEANGSLILPELRDSDITGFAAEARRILDAMAEPGM